MKNTKIKLSSSCNCRINLKIKDVIDISFRPLIQEIASIISTSFKSKQIFGDYFDAEYIFGLVYFNNNKQFQNTLAKILKEEIEDSNREQKIEIPFFFIQELPNLLLQPLINQRPFFYKAFQYGTFHQVYSQDFGMMITFDEDTDDELKILHKEKVKDKNDVELERKHLVSLVKKGDIILDLQLKQQFYLNIKTPPTIFWIKISKY